MREASNLGLGGGIELEIRGYMLDDYAYKWLDLEFVRLELVRLSRIYSALVKDV